MDGYVRSEYLEKAEDSGNDLLTAEAAALTGETEAQTMNEPKRKRCRKLRVKRRQKL